ncbi:MOSC domain-containing protein [Conexibacter sp. SYSU D00693]|uniref:MOSC domain-containing protein n=1 Tax=Conexibacter sp. SYSU D00693 TaxID=2812560 RepID=UPI00196AE233|nr:MOSC domain-containing protein [Conexibacter sp. SYSU D00693]
MDERVVGRVAALWRYPVKSMAAEALDAVDVSWHGLAGDRRWAFVRPGLERSGFPWLTIRERADMAHHVPRFAEPGDPDRSATLVRTPSGEELDVVDPALAEALGEGVRVLRQSRGVFDTEPLSLITTQSVAELGRLAGRQLEPLRFRPNLLVEAVDDVPFAEDGWVGAVLRAGGVRLRLDQRDKRCVMVNVDPRTLERDPVVLRTVAQERGSCAGVYGATVTPGRVAVGDDVVLEAPG